MKYYKTPLQDLFCLNEVGRGTYIETDGLTHISIQLFTHAELTKEGNNLMITAADYTDRDVVEIDLDTFKAILGRFSLTAYLHI